MKYKLRHVTVYSYSDRVERSSNEAYLLPRDTTYQICEKSSVKIEPIASDFRERRDFFNNRVLHFSIQHPHLQLKVTAESEIKIFQLPALKLQKFSWEESLQLLSEKYLLEDYTLKSFLYDSPLLRINPKLTDYAKLSFTPGRSLYEALMDIMQRIFHDFTYEPGYTSISTPLSQVIQDRKGVCQDFAHVGIACLRALGFPARYISGYLETIAPPGKEKLVGADASHAWYAVYFPGYGWLDFDPTNNVIPTNQHITVAWGRDFGDVSPLKGVTLGGGSQIVSVAVDVIPLLDNN